MPRGYGRDAKTPRQIFRASRSRSRSRSTLPSLAVPSLSNPSDDETVIHEDHNHHRLLNLHEQEDTYQGVAFQARIYEPDFAGLDRGIIGRAPEAVTVLGNNAPKPMDINQGDIQYWTFPKETLQDPSGQWPPGLPLNLTASNTTTLESDLIQLEKKPSISGDSQTVWLTISTCDQPTPKSADNTGAPAQLEVYVSLSPGNRNPDNGRRDQVIVVDGGYGYLNLSGVTDGIWIGVRAPTSDNFGGVYNYELAASIDAPYATYFEGDPNNPWDREIIPWDTDSNSSILGTGNITNAFSSSSNFAAWLHKDPPFSIYVNNQADRGILGLQRSICGLRNHAQVQKSDNSMVMIGGQPKQLFYVTNLNSSSSYDAIMTLERASSNSTVGGGGAVWYATNFTTKSDNNCQIIHSLPFCTDVAYAVPSNPRFSTNATFLAQTYNNYTHLAYQNFDKSLQQIPCDTTPSAQYSLARNCRDCDDAYRTWLCAVTIPRCADFSSPATLTHLVPRNVNQSFFNNTGLPVGPNSSLFGAANNMSMFYNVSRNPVLDDKIKPGPYKEVLPCKDLCYHLMQNCPAALQFACPTEEKGLNFSYGHWRRGDKKWLCNWPGGNLVSGARGMGVRWGLMMMGLVLVAVVGAL
ncbi:MAG: hypothetical protein LQ338_001152 [Usnochroma carphineum]|nr:MAG: hypothetical protein LQ338_001152 [Usnochroma carphineum]